MKERKSRVIQLLAAGLVLVSLVVIYAVNRAIPFMMDDEWYSKKLFSEELLTSVGDIIEFQIWHYNNWGGRSMTHTILQLTLMAGENIADILNVLAVLMLAGMSCLTAGGKPSKSKWWAVLAAVGMMLGLNANWKLSMFWQAGAANYLYITIFVLGFLYCYLREVPEDGLHTVDNAQAGSISALQQIKSLPGIGLWILPLGLVAGWSNENMGPAVWIISLLVIMGKVREKKPVKLWMILGNLSCLAGSILVIAAPGNFVRSKEAAANEYGLLWNCFLRCYAQARAALEYLFPALVVLFGILLLYKMVLDKPIGPRRGLLLLGALLSWGAMILSPHYPDRATFGTMMLLICVVISLSGELIRGRKDMEQWLFAGTVLIWLRGMYFLGEFLAICWGWIR